MLSLNVHRRHLSESQRSLVASRLATMRQGERTDLQPSANLRKVSQAEAAKRLNVSERNVTFAALVEREATPELVRAVEQDKIPVSVAAGLAQAPEAVQRRAVADPVAPTSSSSRRCRARARGRRRAKHLPLPDLKRTESSTPIRRGDSSPTRATPAWIARADNHYPIQTLEHDQGARRRAHRRRRLRPIPVGDRSHAAAGDRGHEGMGLRVQELRRLGEGTRRDWLLVSQPA